MEQIQNNRVMTDLYRENAQFPGIALDGSDVYLCWQRFVDRHDSLMASCRRGDEVVWEREISDGGEVLHPVILAHGGAIWYAWSEYARENWRILARCYRDGRWGEVLTVASGEALFFPRLFTWQGRLHVIWTEQHKGSAAAVLCPLTEAGPGAAETVSVVGEAYRAGAAEGGDGNLYVAYDGFDGKQYKLFARARTAAGWSEEIVVSQGEDWASTPWIAAKPDGAVVGWYDYGYMAVYSVRSADLTVRDGALAAVNPQCLKEGVDWYLDLHVASNSSGLQAMAYTRSKYDVLVCTRRGSEPWSRPVLMSYGDGHCGVHPKLLVDEDDTIHLMWQFGFKNGHMERNAQVIYNHLTPAELAQQPDYVAPPSDFTQPIPANADKRLDEHPADVVRAWLDKNGYGNLSVYFGDIHGQSGLSDGMGLGPSRLLRPPRPRLLPRLADPVRVGAAAHQLPPDEQGRRAGLPSGLRVDSQRVQVRLRPQERILPGRRGRDLPLRRQGRHDPHRPLQQHPLLQGPLHPPPPRRGLGDGERRHRLELPRSRGAARRGDLLPPRPLRDL